MTLQLPSNPKLTPGTLLYYIGYTTLAKKIERTEDFYRYYVNNNIQVEFGCMVVVIEQLNLHEVVVLYNNSLIIVDEALISPRKPEIRQINNSNFPSLPSA